LNRIEDDGGRKKGIGFARTAKPVINFWANKSVSMMLN
jgi:hypothetical protein